MKTIIFTIIGLIIYDLLKKGIKLLIIKWNKKKLEIIINGITKEKKMENIDKDYWGGTKWI